MQTLASYLLDKRGLSADESVARATSVSHAVERWLKNKGAAAPADDTGSFPSLTPGSEGAFKRRRYRGAGAVLEEIRLKEQSRGGQSFTTSLYIAAWASRVIVFCTLEVTNSDSIVAPADTDPRCPSIVRDLLELFEDWELNSQAIGAPSSRHYAGSLGGEQVAQMIVSTQRSLPLITISENEGEPVFGGLDEQLSYDLAGLARVVTIDESASWTLTEKIGKANSCYRGAIRLYWPSRARGVVTQATPSTVWTASGLLSQDYDGKGEQRIRSALRKAVMSAASLALEIPAEIAEIQRFESKQKLMELETKTSSQSQELELARLYEEDNQRLATELAEAKQSINQLLGRAEAAEHALQERKQAPAETNHAELAEEQPPNSGEVRFYKKTHSKPSYDVLVRISDCCHATWQSSAKADKARKGVERLEGRSDWKTMQHCGSCTGGGTWKVRW